MTFLSESSAAKALTVAGPVIVGATFLWAGIVKAMAPQVFRAHLLRLGAIPPRLVGAGTVGAAGLEAAWGTALILGVAPAVVLPLTAVLLALLTSVSWWGVRSGRTTDCGCYGGYVVPSLAQSLALNGAFVALTLAAWLLQRGEGRTPSWTILVVAIVGLVVAGLAATALAFISRNGRFMFDPSPLKVGRTWRSRWGVSIADDGSEHLVSYLGPDCPHCRQWVRVLNAIDQADSLPRVLGIVATSNDNLEKFVEDFGIRFPMTTITQTLMGRLVWGVPTTVLVSHGRIQNWWSGPMPREFFQRFRNAFFPLSESQPPSAAPAS